MSFEYVRGEYWLDFRSRVAPTVSGFCRHHDRRRQWKCCSFLLRTKHLTEKSNLPYKPDSSRGGSRAIQTGHRASEVAHMDLAGIQRLTCSLPAVSRLHLRTHNSTPTPCGHHLFVCWAGPSRTSVRFSVSATAPSRRPFPLQPRPRHLKWLRTRVHRDRACVCCVRASRCS